MLDKLNQEEFKRCGLAVVNFEPATSADFIFISFLAESLKNGRSVVYVSATQNLDSFRIAVNKMSIRFDTKNLQFVELGKLLSSNLSESTGTKLLEEIDKLFTAGQQKNLLVVLDNIHLICEDDLNDEISLLLGIQRRITESLVIFGTCREVSDYCFRIPLQIGITSVGSGFGKKVTGQIDVVSYRNDFDMLPTLSTFHYVVGERSIQMFYPGTASMSLTEIPEKFFGKYKLERSENFEEFLASKGVNWFLRKIISMSSITKGIEKSTEQPGRYNFINLSSKMNLQYKNVALGEEFENKGFDGEQHKIVFGMLNPETLSESHVRLNNPQDKGETYHYTVEGDYLVLAMDNEDIHCKRWLKRI